MSSINKAMFVACGVSVLILIFSPAHAWHAWWGQIGFTLGLVVGTALSKRK